VIGHITLMNNALFARFCFFVNMAVSRFKRTGIHAVYFERRTKHTHACVHGTSTVRSRFLTLPVLLSACLKCT